MLNFKKFDWNEKNIYSRYYQDSPVHYAEYSFFALWSWLHDYPLEIAYTDYDLCWFRSSGNFPGIFGPSGNWDNIHDWNKVLNDFEKGTIIYEVPGKIKSILENHENLRFTRDIDQDEYVYLVDDLIKLKGKKYAHKRNRVRAFLDGYEWDYEELRPEIFGEVMEFQEKWRVHREDTMTQEEAASLDGEDIAVRNALDKWNEFNFSGGILRVDGSIIAYTLAEELDSENIDIRFEKAFPEYAGSYQAINYMFLKNHCEKYKYVNREEDMGELGLREAKQSYSPIFMLEKYQMEIL